MKNGKNKLILNQEENFIAVGEPLPQNILCFSHLRWAFVYQRPQHLLTRFSKAFNVYYFEEPVFDTGLGKQFIFYRDISRGLQVLVPHLPIGLTGEESDRLQRQLLDDFLWGRNAADFIFWYYTPMALSFTEHLKPAMTVYDCMDELTGFKNAPKQLIQREETLFGRAHTVFTGGYSLHDVKKKQHHSVHLFPSSIDKQLFALARIARPVPPNESALMKPVIGYSGVIDERFDIGLICEIARQRPEWQLVLIGPIIKIEESSIPRLPNLHLLGKKEYADLPDYLRGWDVALIPFLLNESTRFISPTKTPEYLAAGVPVVSTPIHDVVHRYKESGLVSIAADTAGFVHAIEEILSWTEARYAEWLKAADSNLSLESWDQTYTQMLETIKNDKSRRSAAVPVATQKGKTINKPMSATLRQQK